MVAPFTRGPVALACLMAAASALSFSAEAAGKPRSYIVQLADPPAASYRGGVPGLAATQVAEGARLKVNSAAVQNYVHYLDRQRNAALTKVGGKVQVLHRYNFTFNGFAAVLSDKQARKLARMPGVVSVTLDTPRQLDTNYTPHFLGLTRQAASGR